MHKCSNCGKEFDGKFCPECGTAFVDENACPKCGAVHAPDAKFCPECGARLDGKKFCPKCGTVAEGAFCPECGAKMDGAKRSGGSVAATVKKYLYLSGVICLILSALSALVFTFVSGVSVKGDVPETNMLYYYFGEVFKDLKEVKTALATGFGWKSIGGAREFALYFPAVLGTLISAVGILGVVALSALTAFKAYKKFYKKEETDIVLPAVATFLTFASLATLLLVLNSGDAALALDSESSVGGETAFSTPTLAGLIVGGVFCGLGVVLVAVSRYEKFRGFDVCVGVISSVAVCALAVVVVALAALPAAEYTIRFFNGYQLITMETKTGLFSGLQSALLVTENDDVMFDFIAYCTVGGIAVIALAVISAVIMTRKIPALTNGGNKSCIIMSAVNVALAAAYLACTIFFINDMLADSEAVVSKNFAVPIVLVVMTVLALAAELFAKFFRKGNPVKAAEEVTPAETVVAADDETAVAE